MSESSASGQACLSVIVKAYNEEARIRRCLEAVFATVDPAVTQVILVDSLSEDRTVAVARLFPISIVQICDAKDRGCGAAAQLGFQFAIGRYVLLLDGDMDLHQEFIPAALKRFSEEPMLAGVGGILKEMSTSLEYKQRQVRRDPSRRIGVVPHLNGGGLYRMEALRAVGYLADRNLHACEEFELGLRLRRAGWHLERIDVPYVTHWGHETPPYSLLAKKWRGKYLNGYGELLRTSCRAPGRFLEAAWEARLFIGVIAWWIALIAGLSGMLLGSNTATVALVALLAAPIVALLLRKRNVKVAVYTLALWQMHAAALIWGLLKPLVDPSVPLKGRVVQ